MAKYESVEAYEKYLKTKEDTKKETPKRQAKKLQPKEK